MSDSSSFAPRTLSGIDVVDQSWGGLFRGGRYLAYGTTASGRTLLSTLFVSEGIRSLDTSLLISRLRSTDLTIQAASLGFDLPEALRSGILRVSRTPVELELIDRDDDSLEASLKALASLIIDANADRVVVDDFSAFARFSSFDRFRTALARLVTELEHIPSTLLIGMPEPANDASRRIVDYMSTLMTGCLHVHVECADGFSQRTISLIPQIGHLTRRVDLCWQVDQVVARKDDVVASLERLRHRVPERSTTFDEQEPTPALDIPSPTAGSETIGAPDEYEIEADDAVSFEFSVEPATALSPEAEEQVFLDRMRFTEELQLYFDDYEASKTPFTLVAMRTEEPHDGAASEDFRIIIQALQSVLGREDSVFADPAVERIIIILGEGDTEDAQRLFSRLRARLQEAVPERADHLMNVVAAVVVPDGKPFTTAEEFVHYVLDEA